jgi:hypothetical protein
MTTMKIVRQHQGSTLDQLRELYRLANLNGLYDAADVVRGFIERCDKRTAVRHGNSCCGNVGTHGEGGREYCSTCGQEQP